MPIQFHIVQIQPIQVPLLKLIESLVFKDAAASLMEVLHFGRIVRLSSMINGLNLLFHRLTEFVCQEWTLFGHAQVLLLVQGQLLEVALVEGVLELVEGDYGLVGGGFGEVAVAVFGEIELYALKLFLLPSSFGEGRVLQSSQIVYGYLFFFVHFGKKYSSIYLTLFYFFKNG